MKPCSVLKELPFREFLLCIVLFGLLENVGCSLNEFDWCDIFTNGCNKEHTMCVYKKSKPGDACKDVNFTTLEMTYQLRYKLLYLFNLFRNKIAEGGQPGLPEASNMQQLEWNEELEIFAQRWANQCVTAHGTNLWTSTPLDFCRDLEDYPVAQWATSLTGTGDINILQLAIEHVFALYDGTQEFYENIVRTGYLPRAQGGIILLGATFSYIGCGFSIFTYQQSNESFRVTHLYCNMAPLMLRLTDGFYKPGPPCSHCASGLACNPADVFPSLCQRGVSLLLQSSFYVIKISIVACFISIHNVFHFYLFLSVGIGKTYDASLPQG